MNIINGRVVGTSEDDMCGDVGVVISGNADPVHLGTGTLYVNTTVVTGDGAVIVHGDHHGGIGRSFGGKKK
ncbi:hypothetical protein ABZ260_28645 [Streptosporangium sp. NPDC006013]|uniref:hypothetical protein n=1 Tax=Streptosporangium sp. NPDC006013 TaxID=3155596 RepID=UPI0033BAC977